MNDTTPQMLKKQFEVYHAKSIDEKLQMIIDMMEYGVNQTKSLLRKWYPTKSESELKIEFFKIYYRDDFSAERMRQLVEEMKK